MKIKHLALALPLFLFACGGGSEPTETPANETPAAEEKPATVDVSPEALQGASIYEVNLRQYSEAGTFEAFAEHLPRLKELGVDILWFMPIYPIGEEQRKGALGSYYAVKDYTAVNPEHGTIDDFKALVKQCHEMGFVVILDWVANHTAWDNELIKLHPDWYTTDSLGNHQPPVPDWSDVADLNYDNPELRAYMIDALKFWMEECDVDGYRCDVAEMVPLDFWVEARNALNTVKPNFMLAEGQREDLHQAFDMTYSWEFHHLMNQIAKGEKTASDIAHFQEEETQKLSEEAYRMHFITNHDENTWNGTVAERLGDGADAFAVLSVTVPGMPLVYSGQEAGLNKRLEFFDKDVIEWKEHPNTALYTKLLTMKEEVPAFAHPVAASNMVWHNTGNGNVAVFSRGNNNEALVIINLSGEAQSTIIDGEAAVGSYTNYFTQKPAEISAATPVELAPWAYRILVRSNG